MCVCLFSFSLLAFSSRQCSSTDLSSSPRRASEWLFALTTTTFTITKDSTAAAAFYLYDASISQKLAAPRHSRMVTALIVSFANSLQSLQFANYHQRERSNLRVVKHWRASAVGQQEKSKEEQKTRLRLKDDHWTHNWEDAEELWQLFSQVEGRGDHEQANLKHLATTQSSLYC